MKLHRFYTGNQYELTHELWIDDERLVHQWNRVLRLSPGDQLVLFDADKTVRQYKIERYGSDAVKLLLVTELEPQIPRKEVYLCFSLLKKDKNDWVLQKGTELGVRHFIPLLCDRTEKTGFDIERARKIIIEAAEQCGRADIPSVREPITPQAAVAELQDETTILIADQGSPEQNIDDGVMTVLIGPEGGWSDSEKEYFMQRNLPHLRLSDFTLRAETAAVTAAGYLCA